MDRQIFRTLDDDLGPAGSVADSRREHHTGHRCGAVMLQELGLARRLPRSRAADDVVLALLCACAVSGMTVMAA